VREKEWSAVAMGSSGRTGDCGGGESDLLLFLLPLFLVVLCSETVFVLLLVVID
jgi:hypothetical protein